MVYKIEKFREYNNFKGLNIVIKIVFFLILFVLVLLLDFFYMIVFRYLRFFCFRFVFSRNKKEVIFGGISKIFWVNIDWKRLIIDGGGLIWCLDWLDLIYGFIFGIGVEISFVVIIRG